MANTPTLSLVIPCYNEEGNLRELINAIRRAVDPLKLLYEVVVTDDCSKDNSWGILKELAAQDSRIRAQRFAFNCGESAASWAGLKAARGQYLVTLDADLQNDPDRKSTRLNSSHTVISYAVFCLKKKKKKKKKNNDIINKRERNRQE